MLSLPISICILTDQAWIASLSTDSSGEDHSWPNSFKRYPHGTIKVVMGVLLQIKVISGTLSRNRVSSVRITTLFLSWKWFYEAVVSKLRLYDDHGSNFVTVAASTNCVKASSSMKPDRTFFIALICADPVMQEEPINGWTGT